MYNVQRKGEGHQKEKVIKRRRWTSKEEDAKRRRIERRKIPKEERVIKKGDVKIVNTLI